MIEEEGTFVNLGEICDKIKLHIKQQRSTTQKFTNSIAYLKYF